MDYKSQIETLKNLEAIAYGYNINGEVLGMDCSDFEQIMVDAAESITDLLSRAEAAEREQDQLREVLALYGGNDGITASMDWAKQESRAKRAERCIAEIEDALTFGRYSAAMLRIAEYRGQKEE